MPILLAILSKYWKDIGIALVIVFIAVMGYNHVYDKGYKAAEVKYTQQIDDYNTKLDKRISNVEANSTILVAEAASAAIGRDAELTAITALAKKKPLYVIKGDKCTPSQDFLNSYNALINRGNQK